MSFCCEGCSQSVNYTKAPRPGGQWGWRSHPSSPCQAACPVWQLEEEVPLFIHPAGQEPLVWIVLSGGSASPTTPQPTYPPPAFLEQCPPPVGWVSHVLRTVLALTQLIWSSKWPFGDGKKSPSCKRWHWGSERCSNLSKITQPEWRNQGQNPNVPNSRARTPYILCCFRDSAKKSKSSIPSRRKRVGPALAHLPPAYSARMPKRVTRPWIDQSAGGTAGVLNWLNS